MEEAVLSTTIWVHFKNSDKNILDMKAQVPAAWWARDIEFFYKSFHSQANDSGFPLDIVMVIHGKPFSDSMPLAEFFKNKPTLPDNASPLKIYVLKKTVANTEVVKDEKQKKKELYSNSQKGILKIVQSNQLLIILSEFVQWIIDCYDVQNYQEAKAVLLKNFPFFDKNVMKIVEGASKFYKAIPNNPFEDYNIRLLFGVLGIQQSKELTFENFGKKLFPTMNIETIKKKLEKECADYLPYMENEDDQENQDNNQGIDQKDSPNENVGHNDNKQDHLIEEKNDPDEIKVDDDHQNEANDENDENDWVDNDNELNNNDEENDNGNIEGGANQGRINPNAMDGFNNHVVNMRNILRENMIQIIFGIVGLWSVIFLRGGMNHIIFIIISIYLLNVLLIPFNRINNIPIDPDVQRAIAQNREVPIFGRGVRAFALNMGETMIWFFLSLFPNWDTSTYIKFVYHYMLKNKIKQIMKKRDEDLKMQKEKEEEDKLLNKINEDEAAKEKEKENENHQVLINTEGLKNGGDSAMEWLLNEERVQPIIQNNNRVIEEELIEHVEIHQNNQMEIDRPITKISPIIEKEFNSDNIESEEDNIKKWLDSNIVQDKNQEVAEPPNNNKEKRLEDSNSNSKENSNSDIQKDDEDSIDK